MIFEAMAKAGPIFRQNHFEGGEDYLSLEVWGTPQCLRIGGNEDNFVLALHTPCIMPFWNTGLKSRSGVTLVS